MSDFGSQDVIKVGAGTTEATAANFVSGVGIGAITTTEQHFVYDTKTDSLYFDQDGSGFEFELEMLGHFNNIDITASQLFF